ncbi:MAG TPA: ATP-binding protein [bacterium]|nr:ATP-binding protein [bacterium]
MLLILGIGGALIYEEIKLIRDRNKSYQNTTVTNLAKISQDAVVAGDKLFLLDYLKIIKKTNSLITYAFVVNTRSRIIAHTDIDKIDTLDEESTGKQALYAMGLAKNLLYIGDGYVIDYSVPMLSGQNRVGYVRVGYSKKAIDKELKDSMTQAVLRFLPVVGLAFVIGFIGSFLVASSIASPIERLSRGARQLGAGDWKVRVDIRSNDELGELAQEFNQMAEKLGEIDQLKDDFVSAVSHELRSPLTSIKGYINFVLQGATGPLNNKLKNYLEIVQQNTMRLSQFVDDILDVAKIKAGKMYLENKYFSLHQMVDNLVALFQPQKEQKQIQTGITIPDDLPRLYGDEGKIVQVLTNLMSNAFKFTPEKGRIDIIAIHPYMDEGKKMVRISVRDSGIGIPKEKIKMVFQKFEQVKGTRDQVAGPKGTGLGLTISKGLIEAHGGRIWIESEPGQGATFHFTLPMGG